MARRQHVPSSDAGLLLHDLPASFRAHCAPWAGLDVSSARCPFRCVCCISRALLPQFPFHLAQVRDRKYGRTFLALFAPADEAEEADGAWEAYS